MLTLQDIFNQVVMNDETVAIPFADAKQYNSFRTGLLRKYSRYRAGCQQVGITSYDERFISCSFDGTARVGTFQLKWLEESKRVRKQYEVLKL